MPGAELDAVRTGTAGRSGSAPGGDFDRALGFVGTGLRAAATPQPTLSRRGTGSPPGGGDTAGGGRAVEGM